MMLIKPLESLTVVPSCTSTVIVNANLLVLIYLAQMA